MMIDDSTSTHTGIVVVLPVSCVIPVVSVHYYIRDEDDDDTYSDDTYTDDAYSDDDYKV
jgi:hypothetical protein